MGEKIAIVTDIHGNSPALSAVLKDIDNKGVHRIFCLGDVVGIGPDSNKVLEMLLSRENIAYVVGNHDLAVVAAFRDENPPIGHEKIRAHHQWLAERIDPKLIEFMASWPKQISLTINQLQILLTHYHLDKNDWFGPIDQEPTSERLERIYSETDYRLICFGHHHIVHQFSSAKRTFFNPGSLGCNHQPVARYGIVNVAANGISGEAIEVPYDNRSFLQSYHTLKVPDREFILKIFHGNHLGG